MSETMFLNEPLKKRVIDDIPAADRQQQMMSDSSDDKDEAEMEDGEIDEIEDSNENSNVNKSTNNSKMTDKHEKRRDKRDSKHKHKKRHRRKKKDEGEIIPAGSRGTYAGSHDSFRNQMKGQNTNRKRRAIQNTNTNKEPKKLTPLFGEEEDPINVMYGLNGGSNHLQGEGRSPVFYGSDCYHESGSSHSSNVGYERPAKIAKTHPRNQDADYMDPLVAADEGIGIFRHRDHPEEKAESERRKRDRRLHKSQEYFNRKRQRETGRGSMSTAPIPCKYFREGRCGKGDQCSFNHDIAQRRKNELCKFYATSNCLKGKTCVYMHEEFPCKFFHKHSCRNGDNCKFSHADLTPEMRQLLERFIHDKPFSLADGENYSDDAEEDMLGNNSLLGSAPAPSLFSDTLLMQDHRRVPEPIEEEMNPINSNLEPQQHMNEMNFIDEEGIDDYYRPSNPRPLMGNYRPLPSNNNYPPNGPSGHPRMPPANVSSRMPPYRSMGGAGGGGPTGNSPMGLMTGGNNRMRPPHSRSMGPPALGSHMMREQFYDDHNPNEVATLQSYSNESPSSNVVPLLSPNMRFPNQPRYALQHGFRGAPPGMGSRSGPPGNMMRPLLPVRSGGSMMRMPSMPGSRFMPPNTMSSTYLPQPAFLYHPNQPPFGQPKEDLEEAFSVSHPPKDVEDRYFMGASIDELMQLEATGVSSPSLQEEVDISASSPKLNTSRNASFIQSGKLEESDENIPLNISAELKTSPAKPEQPPSFTPQEAVTIKDLPWRLIPLDVMMKEPYPLMQLPMNLPHSHNDPRLKGSLPTPQRVPATGASNNHAQTLLSSASTTTTADAIIKPIDPRLSNQKLSTVNSSSTAPPIPQNLLEAPENSLLSNLGEGFDIKADVEKELFSPFNPIASSAAAVSNSNPLSSSGGHQLFSQKRIRLTLNENCALFHQHNFSSTLPSTTTNITTTAISSTVKPSLTTSESSSITSTVSKNDPVIEINPPSPTKTDTSTRSYLLDPRFKRRKASSTVSHEANADSVSSSLVEENLNENVENREDSTDASFSNNSDLDSSLASSNNNNNNASREENTEHFTINEN